MSFRYDFFFSYRHRPLDAELTQKCFNLVESYRLPKALKEKGFEDIRRAFRDTEELPVSRILTETIDDALRSTKCLIVVCSTDTPESEWIDREVATFIELGRAEYIFPLLISGDPESSFPPSLKLVPDIAGRVMDIRTPGNHVGRMTEKAGTELLRAISAAVGCTEAELSREHKLRRNRRLFVRTAAGMAAFAAVAAVSLGLMRLAQSYRDTARTREAASMSILNELTYSLPDHLTNVPDAYGRIEDILERNTEDINAILRLSTDKTAVEIEVSANYQRLSSARAALGRYDEALEAQDRAVEIIEALAAEGVEGKTELLASVWGNKATTLSRAGRYEEAAALFDRAIELERSEGGDDRLLARLYLASGSNAVSSGRNRDAEKLFSEGIALIGEPEDDDGFEIAAKLNHSYGVLLYRWGDYRGAEEKLRAADGFYARMSADAGSVQFRAERVKNDSVLAMALSDMGRRDEADAVYDGAIAAARELTAYDDAIDNVSLLADLCNNRAINLNTGGDYEGADAYYAEAAGLYGSLAERTGSPVYRAGYANSLMNAGDNAFKLGDYDRTRDYFERGLAVYEASFDELGDYDRSQYYAWLSYYSLVCLRDDEAALNAALEAYGLQPNNVLVNMTLGYACLYGGYYEDAEYLLNTTISALGEGQKDMILLDLEAQRRAGMDPGYELSLGS